MTNGPPVALSGDRVVLRPVAAADAAPLTAILTAPAVARWWGAWDAARVEAEIIAPTDDTVVLAVTVEDQVIGMIQYAEELDADYRHAGIDVALDPAWHGKGLGADAVRTLARYLFTERGHHRLTIDPAAANTAAIRSYQRVGFRPVGVMRQYERGADGTWHDGLLLDLLPEDLIS